MSEMPTPQQNHLLAALPVEVQQRWCFDGQSVAITISVGVSEFQEDDGLKSAINRADRALYRCKDNGRNRVEVCPGFDETVAAALPVHCP